MICLADICQIIMYISFLLELAAVIVYLLVYIQAILRDSELESPKRYHQTLSLFT